MFDQIDFEKLNEADVREEVIAPLVRALGYRSGTKHNVIREQSLKYAKFPLGRKVPSKDPEVRGKADYIMEVEGRLRWVIEAKPPYPDLSPDDIAQAWTYSNHPEVRAIYFALCNGRRLIIHRTVDGPTAPPLMEVTYDKLNGEALQKLDNLLGPDALLRDYAEAIIDVGVPIAPKLRSIVRVTNGLIQYERSSLNHPALAQLQTGIRNGAVQRDHTGKLIALLTTHGPIRSLQELNERLGLATFEMQSNDHQLSTDPQRPTVFTYHNQVIFPKGERLLDLASWQEVTLPFNLSCDVMAEAAGVYSDRVFTGVFRTAIQYSGQSKPVILSGSFEVHLA